MPRRCASRRGEALAKGAKAHIDPAAFAMDKRAAPISAAGATGVDHAMSVMREESFGPVIGMMKVKDEAEAITLMNDSPYGLTASIWTENVDEPPSASAKKSRPARST